jgi:hypothetical protein
MTPEAADHLGKARQCLDEAKQIAALAPLHHIVAREAYFAAYHAAAAYVFERTGKTVKTHRGLRSEFSRLARAAHRPGVSCVITGAPTRHERRRVHRAPRANASGSDHRRSEKTTL